jgi:lysophospholipase L1-like esterase
VSGAVFYDENGNGAVDAGEGVRLPGVTVSVGGRTSQSTAGGAFTVAGVPAGAQTARAQTLPPYFLAGAAVSVTVPQAAGAPLLVPAVLPIGVNRPNRYMAFGDSISFGEGSSDGGGYRDWLAADLRAYWGEADLFNEGLPGTRSNAGEGRMDGVLARVRPAYSLILYGTNDWNELECKVDFPCFTIDALRSMVRQAKDRNSLPVLGTIPPVNPAFSPPERQDWVRRMNDLVRPMAAQEGALLADIHAALLREGDLPALFVDHVHPNDDGYRIIAREWFRVITTASAAAARFRGEEALEGEALFVEPPSPHPRRRPPGDLRGAPSHLAPPGK